MPNENLLGSFEQLILLALVRLREDAYGMSVRREVEQRTGRSVSLGAVYATLDRLEAKGYVTSRQGAPTPERKGRAKRFFRIESSGLGALEHALKAVERMREGLEGLGQSIGGLS